MVGGRRVAGAIRSLVNTRDLEFECASARILHKTLLVPVLMYGSETMLWKEKSRIKTGWKDNLRELLDIRRMGRVPKAQIRELCRVTKGVDKRIDEGVPRWFGIVENDMIAKRVYVEECAGSCLVGRLRKRWTDTMKACLRKICLDVREARRIVQVRGL